MRSAVGEVVGRHSFLLLLIAGLAIRLLLGEVLFRGEGHRTDVERFAGWMASLGAHGPIGPNSDLIIGIYQPGLMLFLWPFGLATQVIAALSGSRPEEVALAAEKIPSIVADLLIAIVLFRAVRGWSGRSAGLLAAGLYLLVPVTWYVSAVWGQVDSIGALLVLVTVVLLIGGHSETAAAASMSAALVKPQFAIVFLVVGAVLLRRHLLRPGSGPVPVFVGLMARLDRSLGGWLTRRQGPERLVSSFAVGLVTAIAIVFPFRYPDLAGISGLPVIADFAGLAQFVRGQADLFPVLTANAFNPWALVGPEPLAASVGHWTRDSIAVLGNLDALTVGAGLFAVASALAVLSVLRRDDRDSILVAITLLAVAVFVLPTRVHERYLFAAFAVAAPLAAVSRHWRAWYLLFGAIALVNLHAVLTLGGQYGSNGVVSLPFGDVARSGWLVALVSVTSGALLVWVVMQMGAAGREARERARGAYRAFDERWPVRDLVPDAGTALLIVLAVSLLLRAAWLTLPQGALIFDEAYYVNAARVVAGIHPVAGAHYADQPLFLDPNTEHPPLGKVLMAGSILLFGDNGLGWRIPSLVAGMVALVALYGVVRAAGGRPWLGVLAVALYSLDVLSFIHGRIGTLDMMSVALLLVGAWLGLKDRWMLAGAALALGTLIKVPGVYGLLAALLWQGLGIWRTFRLRRLSWRDLAPTGALLGAYVFVGLAGLWLLDLRFTTYATPLDHIDHMLNYGFALQGGFNPTGGITSAPWQWLVNDGQFDYLKTSVNTLANGEVIGSRAIIQFRALLNPALLGAAPLAVLFAVWLAWKRGEALVTWGLLWIAANYLPYWELALLSNRITYFYYVLPAVPGLAVLVSAFLIHGRLPRAVVWGFLGVTILAFIAYFPFRQVP
jgi:predicted membrane-bound dolichyl-phosphate-mannose-protein mannosyltransferase